MKSYTKDAANGRPVFLWGGTMYGEISYRVLTQLYHMEVKAVIDNKIGKTAWAEIPVIRSKDLGGQYGIDILVCAANAFENIEKEAKTYADRDIRVYDCREILKDYQKACSKQIISSESLYVYGDISLDEMILKYNYYAGDKENSYGKRIDLPYCVLCITTKCSLTCRHCAAFITHYKVHADYSLQYVKTVFGSFLQVVDSIQELELMGGEPLLCCEFNEILGWCLEQKKIKAVKIITNGTIVPKEDTWEILKNQKVKFVIDDYGMLSDKCREVGGLAEKYGVRYEVQRLQTWYQLEPVFERGYSERKKAEIFKECAFRTCIGVTNGRLYHCNVAGHMHTAGMLEDAQSNYIQLENQKWEEQELKDRIREFLSIPYLEACGWCNYSAHVEIQAAVQR